MYGKTLRNRSIYLSWFLLVSIYEMFSNHFQIQCNFIAYKSLGCNALRTSKGIHILRATVVQPCLICHITWRSVFLLALSLLHILYIVNQIYDELCYALMLRFHENNLLDETQYANSHILIQSNSSIFVLLSSFTDTQSFYPIRTIS